MKINRILTALAALAAATPAYGQPIYENVQCRTPNAQSDSVFGWSIDIDNDIIAATTLYTDTDHTNPNGSAYLFDASTGNVITRLIPSNGTTANDAYGYTIAINDGVVAVSALGDDEYVGAVYLFDITTGEQIHKLVPSDPYEYFGISVAISDGIVAVGADLGYNKTTRPGAVYLFDIVSGEQIAKLFANDPSDNDYFGGSVAINNGILAVGAIGDDDNGEFSGSAYLFDISTNTQLAKILPDNGKIWDRFGTSIDISNGVVAIGSELSINDFGAVYLFDASTTTQISRIAPNDLNESSAFGNQVSIDSNTIAIGARGDFVNGSYSGSTYLFDIITGDQIAKLLPSDPMENGDFGFKVAMDQGTVIASSVFANKNGTVYAFNVNSLICPPDLTSSHTLDADDVYAFINFYTAQDPIADFTNDGNFDFFDVSAFLTAFAAGCP